jgi:protein gp37
MGANSAIEWVDSTWNPLTGCTKISPGCSNCYAERMSERLRLMGQPNYANGFEVTTHERMLDVPLRWKKPQRIFVNSMSDLYHKDVPFDFIARVFDVMARAHWHTFKILTKRADRLEELSPRLPWPDNVWQGVSVENTDYAFRIDHLRRTGAKTKFLSIEPLLGPMPDLDLTGIDWVIIGGESGPGARPMAREWVLDIVDQCRKAGVATFFKQWGGTNKKKTGRELDGRTYDEFPVPLGLRSGTIKPSPGRPGRSPR